MKRFSLFSALLVLACTSTRNAVAESKSCSTAQIVATIDDADEEQMAHVAVRLAGLPRACVVGGLVSAMTDGNWVDLTVRLRVVDPAIAKLTDKRTHAQLREFALELLGNAGVRAHGELGRLALIAVDDNDEMADLARAALAKLLAGAARSGAMIAITHKGR